MLFVSLAPLAAVPSTGGDPVVWALLGIITTLTTALGLFIRAVLKERDYWRAAFFEEQAQKRELMVTGQVVRSVVRSLPEPPVDAPTPAGGTS